MIAPDFAALVESEIPFARVRRNAPIAPFTTFKVGGPADWLVLAQRAGEVKAAVRAARASGLPITMLGGGSNVLVSDSGVRGKEDRGSPPARCLTEQRCSDQR